MRPLDRLEAEVICAIRGGHAKVAREANAQGVADVAAMQVRRLASGRSAE
jgi:hypothetical protein